MVSGEWGLYMNKVVHKLSFKEKTGYGFGDFASVLYWQIITVYLLYFYTDVFGITAAAAGTMILLTRLWDGINDPLMGIIADRTETRWGKFRPYLIWFSIPLAIMGVLNFTTPDLSGDGKLIYAYVTFFIFMMVYTAINIPYTSLLGVITPDSVERTSVASYKFVLAFLSGSIVSFSILPMTVFLGGGDERRGWPLTMVIFGIVAILLFYLTFKMTRERVRPPAGQKSLVRKDLKDLFQNENWILLIGISIFFILFIAIRISVTTHYFKYFVEDHTLTLLGRSWDLGFVELTSVFNGVGQIFSVFGVLFTSWFAKNLGKKKSVGLLLIITLASTCSFYLLQPENVIIMLILQIIGSFCGGPLTPLLWAMYADTADYSELKTGRRATALIFSTPTMVAKVCWAIGVAMAGWLLSYFGFEANLEQSEQVKEGLRLMMSIIPVIFGLVVFPLLWYYKLDESRVEEITVELNARRASDDK